MLEEVLRAWVPLLVSVIALGTSGWGILQGPARKNADAIRAILLRVEQNEREVAALTATIQHLPTAEDFHKLDNSITEVRGKIETIGVSQRGSERSLERIENVLISMAKP